MSAPEGYAELRIYIPHVLHVRLDGIKRAQGHKGLDVFCVPALEAAAEVEIHKATVLLRCAGINPLARVAQPEPSELIAACKLRIRNLVEPFAAQSTTPSSSSKLSRTTQGFWSWCRACRRRTCSLACVP